MGIKYRNPIIINTMNHPDIIATVKLNKLQTLLLEYEKFIRK